MSAEQSNLEHNRLYKEACELVYSFIEIHGWPMKEIRAADEVNLRRGMSLLEQVLRINPRNWSAMWLLGKAYQCLQDFAAALEWFSRAHDVNPDHPDVSREAAITAMNLGRPSDAIPFCESAIKAKPTDPGLRANLALALLFSQDVKRACEVAQDALERDPTDTITHRLAGICEDVRAGKRACPRHVRDLGA